MSAEGRPGERRLRQAERHARDTGRVHIIPFLLMPREDAIAHRIFRTRDAWRNLIATPRTTFEGALVDDRGVRGLLMEKIEAGIERTKRS